MPEEPSTLRMLNSVALDLKFQEIDGGLLIHNVPLLANGTWTDSAKQTALYYPEATLREYAGNWVANGVWVRHTGKGAPRSITDKVGEIRSPHLFIGRWGFQTFESLQYDHSHPPTPILLLIHSWQLIY